MMVTRSCDATRSLCATLSSLPRQVIAQLQAEIAEYEAQKASSAAVSGDGGAPLGTIPGSPDGAADARPLGGGGGGGGGGFGGALSTIIGSPEGTPHNFTAERLETSARASLARLRVASIDLFYLHFPSRMGFGAFGWASWGAPERYAPSRSSDGSVADFDRQG